MTVAYEQHDDDARRLQELEAKLQIIRDRVNGVVHHYHTACYLVGRPGTESEHDN